MFSEQVEPLIPATRSLISLQYVPLMKLAQMFITKSNILHIKILSKWKQSSLEQGL
jgi:hypothetical protein